MDELLQRVAEIKGMPASLVLRSAQARADKTDSTVEAVLAEWAGEADSAAPAPASGDQQPATDAPQEEPDAVESEAAPSEITTDYLVQLAADAKRMPPKLILSSATTRAEHGNTTLEEVLADWAGVDLDELKQQAAPTPTPTPTTDEPEAPSAAAPTAAPVAAAAATALTLDELLEKVAEVKGMPAPLAKRSAEARAKKTGESVEDVLAEWAGVEAGSAAAEPEPSAVSSQPSAEAAPAAAAAATALTLDELLEKVAEAKGMPAALAKRSAEGRSKKTGEPVESILAEWAGVEAGSVTAESAPSAVSSQPSAQEGPEAEVREPETGPEVIEASTPEIEEPSEDEEVPAVRGGYPRWLAAAFVLIPLLAVVYLLVAPNGPDCGTAGQLAIDAETGVAVNCDGSEYGTTEVDYYAQGAGLYSECVACHAADGSGGAGPAFAGGAVLSTFPADSCDEHIEWIRVGTAGWESPTYGATETPVGGFGLMPAFGSNMTDEQLASVALYERVEFGNQPLEEAEVDCGLSIPEGETEGETAES